MNRTLFDDQAKRRSDAKQGEKIVYEDEPDHATASTEADDDSDMAVPDTDPETVRDRAYADVDVTEKQAEYMRVCWGCTGEGFSTRLWEQRVEAERMMFDSEMSALTDMEAARILGWPRSAVNGRRNELVEKGVMRADGQRECRVTSNTATVWTPVKDLFR